jgi:hypothetical protein
MNWFEASHTELKQHFSNQEMAEEERKALCLASMDGLHALFHELVKELKIKDEWPEAFYHLVPFATGTVEKSGKMGTLFTMAITTDGWLLEAGLRCSEHIRHMTDEFWRHVTNLASVGKASLSSSNVPGATPEAKRLAQHKGSLVFSLARDYVFQMQAPLDDDRRGSYSVGHIEVLLPLESNEGAVRQFFKDGIEGLYRANYLLYRSAYIEFKRLLKKHGVKEPQLSKQMEHFAEC